MNENSFGCICVWILINIRVLNECSNEYFVSLHLSYLHESHPTLTVCSILHSWRIFWKEKRSNACSSKLINIWIVLKWAYHHIHLHLHRTSVETTYQAECYGHDSSNNGHTLSNCYNFESTKTKQNSHIKLILAFLHFHHEFYVPPWWEDKKILNKNDISDFGFAFIQHALYILHCVHIQTSWTMVHMSCKIAKVNDRIKKLIGHWFATAIGEGIKGEQKELKRK